MGIVNAPRAVAPPQLTERPAHVGVTPVNILADTGSDVSLVTEEEGRALARANPDCCQVAPTSRLRLAGIGGDTWSSESAIIMHVTLDPPDAPPITAPVWLYQVPAGQMPTRCSDRPSILLGNNVLADPETNGKALFWALLGAASDY